MEALGKTKSMPPLAASWRLWALALAMLGWFLLYSFAGSALQQLEAHGSDAWWRWWPQGQDERRVVIVDIDEPSLAQLGAWPWSSAQWQQLSERLHALGAGAQIFDLVFPGEKAGSADLAMTLRRHGTVVGQAFALLPEQKGLAIPPQDPVVGMACHGSPFPQATGVVANDATLAGLPTGHMTPYLAPDGAVREVPALICYRGKLYPALALRAWLQALGLPLQAPNLRLQAGQGLADPAWWLRLPGEMNIPLNSHGALRVPYRLAPQSFVALSVRDVLQGRVPEGALKGAWVLVGSTALGLADAVPTPHGGGNAGVSVQAQLLTALLDQRIPLTPQGAGWAGCLFAGLGFVLLYRLAATSRWLSGVVPLATLTYALLGYVLHGVLLLGMAYWLPWLLAVLAVLLYGLSLVLVGQLATERRQARLYRHLSSYAPGWFARRLLQHSPLEAVIEPVAATVLVADVRNFSAYCDTHPATDTAQWLHRYLTTLSAIVQELGGEIETLHGDTVIALWRAPEPQQGARLACLAAQKMVHAMEKTLVPRSKQALFLDQALSLDEEHTAEATAARLAIGIGLEYGEALVGALGDFRRRHHVVLGETVRAAWQLQNLSAELASPILLGQQLHHLLPTEMQRKHLGAFLLEGFVQPRPIYALALGE